MPPTVSDRLAHILEAIVSVEDLVKTYSRSDIASNRHLRLSLERELEIISEASRKVPDAIKNKNANIDWRGMADIGNRLRHAYHASDIEILLLAAEHDLPPLKAFVEQVLTEEGKP